ncbi:MAG: hypothetical protein AB7P12_16225 [Alphaproteobacteria bacterium]
MYAAGDPRASLPNAPKMAAPTAFKGAEYARFYDEQPQETEGDSRTWYARGQNMIVAYTEGKAGLVLDRAGQPDEYVVLVPGRDTRITVEAAGERLDVDGHSLVVVPAGASRVVLETDGVVVRLLTTRSTDLAARCSNAESYARPDPNVAPFEPWPGAAGSDRVRVYSLDVPDEPGRFGRIFRCSTIMVNFIKPSPPRDISKMSPHHHDDFEQYSLCLEGAYTHHLRWPWITDMAQWRKDEAELCKAPSVAVIPPPAIHTSQSMDPAGNLLVDVFCPPRADFSAKPGWVINAADYPMPQQG